MNKNVHFPKANFNDEYCQKTPQRYLQEMYHVSYELPQNTKPIYLSLIKHLFFEKHKLIWLLDIGSSYGINTMLLKYGLNLGDIRQFFLHNIKDLRYEAMIGQFCGFLKKQNIDSQLRFYLLDVSKPAVEFAKNCGLCVDGLVENLEKSEPTEKLLQVIPRLDLIISTGCLSYIGCNTFGKILKAVENSKRSYCFPVFAFSCLRIVDMKRIRETFTLHGYELTKLDIPPLRQRSFKDQNEYNEVFELLKNRELPILEEDGYYYADFYVGVRTGERGAKLDLISKLEQDCA